MPTANVFFSLLALATNAATIAAIVVIAMGRSAPAHRLRAIALPLATAVAVVSTLGSLYYSEIAGLRPCTLCWYQRGAMYPLAVVLVVALVLRRPAVWKIAFPLAVVGALLSSYHYLIQHVPSLALEATCSVDVPCTAAEVWQFGFISLAYMAGSAFVLIALLSWFGMRALDQHKVEQTTAGMRTAGVSVTATLAVAAVTAVLFATPAPSPDAPVAAAGEVTIDGQALPVLEQPTDAAGLALPELTGTDYEGNPVTIAQDGRPKVVMVVAHWCPHCQVEVPAVQTWLDDNGPPDAVDLYSVSTAADAQAPNYPPQDWLVDEGWTVPVIADDEAGTGRTALGVSGYPFFVFVASDGTVVQRHAGELGVADLSRIVSELGGDPGT